MVRFILEASPDDLILAARAAKAMLKYPEEKKSIIVGFEYPYPDFYVVRNKASIAAIDLAKWNGPKQKPKSDAG